MAAAKLVPSIADRPSQKPVPIRGLRVLHPRRAQHDRLRHICFPL